MVRHCAPKNTPIDIIHKLYIEINAGLADPSIKARLADAGVTLLTGSTAGFGNLIVEETEKWAKVIKFAGLNRSDPSRHSINSVPRNRGRLPAPGDRMRGR